MAVGDAASTLSGSGGGKKTVEIFDVLESSDDDDNHNDKPQKEESKQKVKGIAAPELERVIQETP